MIVLCQRRGWQRAVSAALIGSYLLVLAMSASPALHQWLHNDADEADHQCAVVTTLSGQIDVPPAGELALVAPPPLALEWSPARRAVRFVSIFLVTGVMEHAPPALA